MSTRAENRSALAGVLASVALAVLDTGLMFLSRGLVDDARGSGLAAVAIVLGLVVLIGLNFWLWMRLAPWFDRLLGGDGR